MLPNPDKRAIKRKNLDIDMFLKYKSHFKNIRAEAMSPEIMEHDFETVVLEREKAIMEEFGFEKAEVDFIMRQKPRFLFSEPGDLQGIHFLRDYLVSEHGFDMDQVRTLVVKYPQVLSKRRENFETLFRVLETTGLDKDKAFYALLEYPRLISVRLEENIKGQLLYFDLYMKITKEEAFDMFRAFPYLFCIEPDKVRQHLESYRKLQIPKEEIIMLIKKNGGIIAGNKGLLLGLFDYLKTAQGVSYLETRRLL